MWQPPAYSPLTRYFYTMAINEPHIYKVKPLKPWVPGTPEVGQQFGNAVPTEAERKAARDAAQLTRARAMWWDDSRACVARERPDPATATSREWAPPGVRPLAIAP